MIRSNHLINLFCFCFCLQEKDVRIILGNFDEEWALLLFCEAYRQNMIGRKYQWILTGISEDKLWLHYKFKGSSCSDQELIVAMDGYITTDISTVTRSQLPTISGMVSESSSKKEISFTRECLILILVFNLTLNTRNANEPLY